MRDAKSSRVAHAPIQPATRLGLTASELDALVSLVQAHFDEHQPEAASFPAMASRVIDLAEHPDVDINRLAHLIERDPAICAAVLAVANSAANRRTSPVQSVRTAVALLGLKRVANIAVGIACRSLFDVELRVQHELFPQWWSRLFHAAMTEAFASSFVAMERTAGGSEGIFLAGMLHNFGKSLALQSLAALLIAGQVAGIPSDEAVEELLRRTRIPIGVAALRTFNLPDGLVTLCNHQDDDGLPNSKDWADLHVVRVVSSLNDLRMATFNTVEPIRLLLSSARCMEMKLADILTVARQVSDHAAEVSLLFSATDGSNESGYLDFVSRCLIEAGWSAEDHSS